ncbi:MAG: diguanylate cyclase [Acidobacteriaceae bacterium]
METHVVLLVGAVLLSGGCIGLLIVRLTNPFFKSLGWLSATFGSATLGAALFAAIIARGLGHLVLLPDTLILLAFVFLHVCFLELNERESRVPWLGFSLLVAQALGFPFFYRLHDVRRLSAATLGVLMAVQVCQSAVLLWRTNKARKGMDAPVWYNISLLLGFAMFNIFRSAIVLALGTPRNPQMPAPMQATAAVVFLGAGIGLGFGVFWMESQQIRLRLEQLANIDPLTGIYNRRSFIALCERELLSAARNGGGFSLIMFDLDHFKQINDRYGHRAGDAVLCEVVEKLRNSVRNIDIVGRWGGEEFVALLPKADAEAAMAVASRLRQHVDSISMSSPRLRHIEGESEIAITLSIGMATYFGHDPAVTIHDLLHQCDSAMYQAKTDGRDRIVSVDPQMALIR